MVPISYMDDPVRHPVLKWIPPLFFFPGTGIYYQSHILPLFLTYRYKTAMQSTQPSVAESLRMLEDRIVEWLNTETLSHMT